MIGDVLTSSILFEALKNKYPSSELHYLIHKNTFPVVESNPHIDRVIFFDPSVDSKPKGLLPMLKRIKDEGYDVVIDVYSKISTAIIAAFSGAKKRISYYKKYTSGAYTHKYELSTKVRTNAGLAIENRMLLLQGISEDFPLALKPKIYLTKEEKSAARSFLSKSGIVEEVPLFMVSILGSSSNKTYPFRYMAQLLEWIVAVIPDVQLLFNYIPSQKADAEKLYQLCTKEVRGRIFFDVYGKNLREFIALTSQCRAVIGNEGGAINIAKALNIPNFGIFSPWIKKEAWNSYENERNVVVHLKDYHPELFLKTSVKSKVDQLYQKFRPDLFQKKYSDFIKNVHNFTFSADS